MELAETVAPPVIAMQPVKSSQIAAIGHDPATNTLAIQFPSKTGSGSLYHYQNFTAEQFDEFLKVPSIGSHFISKIKPATKEHPYTKVS